MDHLEDDLKTLDTFNACQDRGPEEKCADKFAQFLLTAITKALSRHSKRPSSLEVFSRSMALLCYCLLQMMQSWDDFGPI